MIPILFHLLRILLQLPCSSRTEHDFKVEFPQPRPPIVRISILSFGLIFAPLQVATQRCGMISFQVFGLTSSVPLCVADFTTSGLVDHCQDQCETVVNYQRDFHSGRGEPSLFHPVSPCQSERGVVIKLNNALMIHRPVLDPAEVLVSNQEMHIKVHAWTSELFQTHNEDRRERSRTSCSFSPRPRSIYREFTGFCFCNVTIKMIVWTEEATSERPWNFPQDLRRNELSMPGYCSSRWICELTAVKFSDRVPRDSCPHNPFRAGHQEASWQCILNSIEVGHWSHCDWLGHKLEVENPNEWSPTGLPSWSEQFGVRLRMDQRTQQFDPQTGEIGSVPRTDVLQDFQYLRNEHDVVDLSSRQAFLLNLQEVVTDNEFWNSLGSFEGALELSEYGLDNFERRTQTTATGNDAQSSFSGSSSESNAESARSEVKDSDTEASWMDALEFAML